MENKLHELCIKAAMQGEKNGMCRLQHDLPKLVIERFGSTVVLADHTPDGKYRKPAESAAKAVPSVLYKYRSSRNFRERNGIMLSGTPDTEIVEHGVKYAVNLTLNQDNSFYGDTRNLREYLLQNTAGETVLNTFAYTGSLGIAALAGGAEKVVQTDLSGKFLQLAEKSLKLNDLNQNKMEIVTGNFFPVMSDFKKNGRSFDTVILDPPFFSRTPKGTVDLLNHPAALVNKVRPLVRHDGKIIMVNNALYLSGKDFISAADALCDGKYLIRTGKIDIPEEFCNPAVQIADPAPFNHPTKIIIFQVG